MIRRALLAGVILSGVLVLAGETRQELRDFFKKQMKLSDDQIATIARGKAVAKVLPSNTPAEIFIFGAVFVNATPEEYVKLAFNVARLRKLPSYLAIGPVSNQPVLSDLEGFTLEPTDITELKDCRPGKCEVQLPADAMHELQEAVDWSRSDVTAQVNERLRKMGLNFLRRYQEDGNSAFGTYNDKDRPFDVHAQLQSWLERSEALPIYLPELRSYLLDYPGSAQAKVESLFYWEKVNFGLKTTLRLNHAIAYRSDGPRGAAHVVAVKQLFASHYFQLALDLTACVTQSGRTSDTGFYLISLRGSTQQGLSGFKGALLRRVVVSRTRTAQEKALIGIKMALESSREYRVRSILFRHPSDHPWG